MNKFEHFDLGNQYKQFTVTNYEKLAFTSQHCRFTATVRAPGEPGNMGPLTVAEDPRKKSKPM